MAPWRRDPKLGEGTLYPVTHPEETVIIVSGTRWATEKHLPSIENAMLSGLRAASLQPPFPVRVVEGEADGVDRLSKLVAAQRYWPVDPVPADWETCGEGCPPGSSHRRTRRDGSDYCPVAGPRRNQLMLDKYPNAFVVAMPGYDPLSSVAWRAQSKGSWRMVEQAAAMGRRFLVHPLQVTKGTLF